MPQAEHRHPAQEESGLSSYQESWPGRDERRQGKRGQSDREIVGWASGGGGEEIQWQKGRGVAAADLTG